jgi:hypothetical protein
MPPLGRTRDPLQRSAPALSYSPGAAAIDVMVFIDSVDKELKGFRMQYDSLSSPVYIRKSTVIIFRSPMDRA